MFLKLKFKFQILLETILLGESNMNKNHRRLLIGSLIINVILVVIVILGYNQLHYVMDRTLAREITNIIVLEDLINDQIEEDWEQSGLVTTKVQEIIHGIQHSEVIGTATKRISKDDLTILYDFALELQAYQSFNYPIDKLPSYDQLSDQDKDNYAKLATMILETNFEQLNETKASSYLQHSMDKLETLLTKMKQSN